MTGRLLAVAVAGALMAGCGGDDDAATVVISGLQTEQGTLIGSICGFPGERVHRAGASRARRQLNVLLRELRARPDARVRTFYYADDSLLEKGGRKREISSLLIVIAPWDRRRRWATNAATRAHRPFATSGPLSERIAIRICRGRCHRHRARG